MLEFVICDVDKDTLDVSLKIVTKTLEGCNYNLVSFINYGTDFMRYVRSNIKKVVYILSVDSKGISMIKTIRDIDHESIIIVLTEEEESLANIYKDELNILTVIGKGKKYEDDLILAVRASISYFMGTYDILSFSDLATNYNIPTKDILYIVKNGRKTLIKTDIRNYEVYTSLDKLKKSLPRYFKQSHRACIINMKRISSLNCSKKSICFDTGEYTYYIRDKYKKELIL